MNNGDQVIVFPEGKPERKARATVAIISANQRSIAVGFDERPDFVWGDPLSMAIHPHFGIMLFASRPQPSGPWIEMMGEERFQVLDITYIAGWDENGDWIACSLCGLKSYNPNDVTNRYCGKCHHFHHGGKR